VLQALRRALAIMDVASLDILELLLERFRPVYYDAWAKYLPARELRDELVKELGASRNVVCTRMFYKRYDIIIVDWDLEWPDHPLTKACAEKDYNYILFLIDEVHFFRFVYLTGSDVAFERQHTLEHAIRAALTIPTSFAPDYDGASWHEGLEGGKRWRQAFDNL